MSQINIEFLEKKGSDLIIHIGLGRLVERPKLLASAAFLPSLMVGSGALSVDQFCRIGVGQVVPLDNGQVRRLALTFLAARGLESSGVTAVVEEMAHVAAEKTHFLDSFEDWADRWFQSCWPRRFSILFADDLPAREEARAEFIRRFHNRIEGQKNYEL